MLKIMFFSLNMPHYGHYSTHHFIYHSKWKIDPRRASCPEEGDAEGSWKSVARNHGMTGPTLKAFNVDPATGEVIPLKAGATIYLPSADEILFEQLYAKHRDYKKAEAEYGEMKAAHHVDVLRAARDMR